MSTMDVVTLGACVSRVITHHQQTLHEILTLPHPGRCLRLSNYLSHILHSPKHLQDALSSASFRYACKGARIHVTSENIRHDGEVFRAQP